MPDDGIMEYFQVWDSCVSLRATSISSHLFEIISMAPGLRTSICTVLHFLHSAPVSTPLENFPDVNKWMQNLDTEIAPSVRDF